MTLQLVTSTTSLNTRLHHKSLWICVCLRNVTVKLHFSNGLVGLTIEMTLSFQIPPA